MGEIDGVCDGHVCRGTEKVGRLGFFLFLGDIFWVSARKYQEEEELLNFCSCILQ